jgi:hypothetical protein
MNEEYESIHSINQPLATHHSHSHHIHVEEEAASTTTISTKNKQPKKGPIHSTSTHKTIRRVKSNRFQ